MVVLPDMKKELGDLVAGILENKGLTLRGAFYKTGVHYTTISDMKHGRVPSRRILEQFAYGLGEDAMPLLIAAGYERTADPAVRVEDCLQALRIEGRLTEDKYERILKYAAEVIREVDEEGYDST